MYEFLTGSPPFFKNDRESLFENIKNSYELKVPPHVSTTAISLIGKMLNKIPDKRIGFSDFSEIKNHKFFKGMINIWIFRIMRYQIVLLSDSQW